MAGCSSSFARETRSSGREAPSRKLNAEAECSSTYFNRRFLPRTSASHAGPYRLDRVQSRFHSPRVPLELWDVTSLSRCPILRAPTPFRTTSHLFFSTVQRTQGFACEHLRSQGTLAFHFETQPLLGAEACKCAWPWSLGQLRPTFPAKQTGSAEKNQDCVCRAELAHQCGFPRRCFEFARVRPQDAPGPDRAAETTQTAANVPSRESPTLTVR